MPRILPENEVVVLRFLQIQAHFRSGGNMPLPVAAKIRARLALHGEADDPRDLIAVAHASVVLAP